MKTIDLTPQGLDKKHTYIITSIKSMSSVLHRDGINVTNIVFLDGTSLNVIEDLNRIKEELNS
ncbi:hypothetical protein [Leeuwenhoekiella sp. LLG6367-2.1]|uniref:hypothetical protein n=1 Tax=Leeuwenhoekiella sp. LLG6367-2.1 TaxID=3160833 RepID=UPI00386F6C22